MIVLKYTINGARMRRTYDLSDAFNALARAQALRNEGITVRIKGLPKRVTMAQALEMGRL